MSEEGKPTAGQQERTVDQRFAEMMARGVDLTSNDLTKRVLEEAEVKAASTLVALLEVDISPSVRFNAAKYILELTGHAPGGAKAKEGYEALLEKLAQPGPVEPLLGEEGEEDEGLDVEEQRLKIVRDIVEGGAEEEAE